MSVQELRETRPKARKPHRCSLCTGRIEKGEHYSRSTNVYDGRLYDWLTCQPCLEDGIPGIVWDWSYGTFYSEGFDADTAHEWATEAVIHGNPSDQRAAKNYLARAGGDSYYELVFDQWLKAHDAEVAARELRVFARAQDSWCEAGRAEQMISRRAVRDALIARAEDYEMGRLR